MLFSPEHLIISVPFVWSHNFICAGHHSIFNFTILFVLNEDYFQTFVGPQISSTSYNQIVEKQPERGNLNWLEIKVILYHYIQGNENNNGRDFPDTMQVFRTPDCLFKVIM